jgi:hypothetical protein
LSVAFWYDNDFGSNPGLDVFVIQVSNNGGLSWQILESYNASVDVWVTRSYALAQAIPLTAQMRVRFHASDPAGAGSVVEAGVDAFKVEVCVPGAPQPSLSAIAEAAGTYPVPLLSFNDSTGGSDRRVEAAIGTDLRMIVNQPATNPLPAGFAVFGRFGIAGPGDPTTAPGIGPVVFPLCVFDPGNPSLFVLADTLGGSLCSGSIPAPPAPWVFELPGGLAVPVTATLQGVIESGSGLAVTNALIVRIQ